METIAPHKPRVIFMAADQKPWSWLPHSPVETKLCIASTVANGANLWYGLHGSTRLLDTPGGRAGQEMIRFLRPLPGRYVELAEPDQPAIVLNRFGQGASLYFAGTFGEMYSSFSPPEYRRLFHNAVNHFTTRPFNLTGIIGNVELVVRRQKGGNGRKERLIVHLINYSGVPVRPFEKVYPQRHLKLQIRGEGRFTRARALRAKRDCPLRAQNGICQIELLELQGYEIIVLDRGNYPGGIPVRDAS
ncbi:MAG: hypothetical protein HY360_25165 [Verrucomicrobia bacterium]|nr:hypothetical protein [Verrucomicrobiota bacterium]